MTMITPQAVRAHLQCILASDVFARSQRMQRFLEYIVEETLAGRTGSIGEYGIGVAVFDRGENFEPMVDPIVRNEARRLRFKLMEFYRQAEPGDLTIEIPKGGYVPVFAPVKASLEAKRPTASAPAPQPRRLAVLPFDSLCQTPECEMAGRALCFSLTAGLTNLGGLETVAHSCLKERSIRDAASEFSLSHVIQGSIIKFGARFRVIVNLIHVQNGTQIWAREYDSENGEMLAFQSEVSRSITKEVTARLDLPRPQVLSIARAA